MFQLHLPWFVSKWLIDRWPRLYHLIQFGRTNINTAEHWDRAWAKHGKDGFRATTELQNVRGRIVSEIPAGSFVLDVGCGTGELLDLLNRARGTKSAGVDISAVAVDAVRAKGFDAKVAHLPSIPYPPETFDVVVCTETLEHVTAARKTVTETSVDTQIQPLIDTANPAIN